MKETLTKARLQELGVTNVTEDGKVFVNGVEKSPYIIKAKHKYGNNCEYMAIALYDYSKKYDTVHKHKRKDGVISHWKSWAYAVKTIPLARLMLAWFEGEIAGNMDADHIDGNPMNNHLSNLQILSRRENLAKRVLTWSEINKLYWAKKRELEKERQGE